MYNVSASMKTGLKYKRFAKDRTFAKTKKYPDIKLITRRRTLQYNVQEVTMSG